MVVRHDTRGEPVVDVVGRLECLLEVVDFDHGEDWPEDFLLGDAEFVVDVGEDGRFDEVTLVELVRLAAAGQLIQEALMLLFDLSQIVVTRLMTQPARATVDEDDDLVLLEPERLAHLVVEDVSHALDLEEVIPRAERADLVLAAVLGFLADFRGVGFRSDPFILAMQQVTLDAVAVLDGPLDAAL